MPQKPHHDHGLLWRALAVSLALHVFFLLQTITPSSVLPAGSRLLLTAQLTSELPSPGVDAAPSPLFPQTAPARKAAEEPVVAPAKASSVPAATASSTLPAELMAKPGETEGATSQPPAFAATNADADFAENRKSYLFAIAAEARRSRKYPPRALAAGWTGTAEIGISISAGGLVQPTTLKISSGHADIDNTALALVRNALGKTPVPEGLRNRSFELSLPIVFNIDDR